jgi:hypothetical protein
MAQHDHGLVSGRLAAEWRGLSAHPAPLPFELRLAITLHDFAWESIDLLPLFNPETRRPYDFVQHPLELKARFYTKGLDLLERIEPRVGLLCSMHYTAFIGTDGLEPFQRDERNRRARLKLLLGLTSKDDAMLNAQLHVLKLFDNLSLFICLMSPSALDKESFPWLDPSFFAQTHGGEPFDLQWLDDETLVADPFPFTRPVDLTIPYRELPATFPNADGLTNAWNDADTQQAHIRLQAKDD